MKKQILLIIGLCLTLVLQAQTSTAPSGSGTSSDPYQIASLDNLYWISQNSSSWSSYFLQTADIDASSTSTWDSGAGWTPLGSVVSETSYVAFTGSYNGAGHYISGLTINRPSTGYVGFFCLLYGATIQNLGLVNATITGGGETTGALSGLTWDSTTTVSNCYSTGTVNGINQVGGLVGDNSGAVITHCYSNCAINSSEKKTGGLVGSNSDGGTVSYCFATGVVSGGESTGGLVGQNNSTSTISNCYSRGNVSGTADNVGGLVGRNVNAAVTNSYSTGTAYSLGCYGDILGSNEGDASISNSFWDTNSSGLTSGCGYNEATFNAIGKTTTEMKTQSTFTNAGWDFSSIWVISSTVNNGYPSFVGQVTYNVTVPVGTKACYIAGEMNSWIQQVMTKVDDTHYSITIQNADISQQYKYCSGPSWDYQEMSETNDYISDRSYSASDVVANWLAVFDPSTVTASDYYLPLKTGNYTELYTTDAPNGWCLRTTKYSYKRTDEINGIPYYLEEGWEDNFTNCSGCTDGPFRYMWIRKDSLGNLLLGAYAAEDYGGTLTDDISKAYVLPEPLPWFPNTFLNVGGYTAFALEETVMNIDSVISVTATAGSYTNCIQLRNIERTSGIVTFIEDSYYAYHVGLVMQNRLLPVEDIHTNYITDYLADSPTGIKGIKSSDNSFTLYPNPATDGFYIEAGEKAATVSIYDLNGTTLLTKQIATGKELVPISTLPQGLYMVKIASENGVTVKKLLKK